MPDHAVVLPFLATMLLTLAAWLWLYVARFRWFTSARINPQDMALGPQPDQRPPVSAITSTAHFSNLFELPTLFYGLCLFVLVVGIDDRIIGGAAWCFFAGRCVHTLIHLSINRVIWRFVAYALSALALWAMLLRAVWIVLATD